MADRAPRKCRSPARFVLHTERCWFQGHVYPLVCLVGSVEVAVCGPPPGPRSKHAYQRGPDCPSVGEGSVWHGLDSGEHTPRTHPLCTRTHHHITLVPKGPDRPHRSHTRFYTSSQVEPGPRVVPTPGHRRSAPPGTTATRVRGCGAVSTTTTGVLHGHLPALVRSLLHTGVDQTAAGQHGGLWMSL